MSEIITIILAAGKGKRMASTFPKILHPVCGRPMIDYPLEIARAVGSKKTIVVAPAGVTPPEKEKRVAGHLKNYSWAKVVVQKKPLGTANAVSVCSPSLNGFKGSVMIVCGDTPLLKKKTVREFLKRVAETDATVGFITTRIANPSGYGRVVRDAHGEVQKIVEEKEATPAEKNIREINTGIYSVKAAWLFATLRRLNPHPVTREYYLTDIIERAIQENQKLVGFFCEESEEFLGVNTQQHLAQANEEMRDRLIEHWLLRGVIFLDPRHVYLDADVVLGEGTVIHPQVYLYGKTKVGKNCVLECGAVLKNMTVADRVHIKPYCVLEEGRIESEAQVGPFARMRPGSVLGKKSRIGNFVELKKTKLGRGVKVNHLTYLGDAVIGDETNVGCGTITCNYDGVKKHPTKVGKKVFIGSDVQFVAPVKIGDGAYIGAGSTITENVPAKALAIARGRQVVKRNYVRNHRIHRRSRGG